MLVFDVSPILSGPFADDMPAVLEVEAEYPGEKFSDAWRRSFEVAYPGVDDWFIGWWKIRLDEPDLPLMSIDPDMPVAEAERFFGSRDSKIGIAWGLGGDGHILVDAIWTLLSLGLTLEGILSITGRTRDGYESVVNRETRRVYEDWRDSGDSDPSDVLVRAIRRRPCWHADRLRAVFGEDGGRLSDAMRGADYVPRRDARGHRVWVEKSDEYDWDELGAMMEQEC
ncbi:hypothetical protein [Microbacterium awajiense]